MKSQMPIPPLPTDAPEGTWVKKNGIPCHLVKSA
jgi:hypothetical protein